jgi:hypothetical protein
MNTLQKLSTFALILLSTLAANPIKEENVVYRIKGQEDTGELIISTDYLPLGQAGDGLTVSLANNKGDKSSSVNCGYLLEEIYRETLEKYLEETKKNEKKSISVTGKHPIYFSILIHDEQVTFGVADEVGEFGFKVSCTLESAKKLMEKIRAFRGNADLRLPEGSFETFKKEIELKTVMTNKPAPKSDANEVPMD